MADVTALRQEQFNTPLKFVDQGDGSYAVLVAIGEASFTIGKLAANSGVDIGDVDVTSLPALPAGTNSIGSTKDNGPAWTVVRTYTTSADMTTPAAISAAPTSGQKVVADDIIIFSDTEMSFTIQEETSGTVYAKVFLAANGSAQITLRDGLKTDTVNKKFFGRASTAGNVTVTCCQHSEA